ncbi:MAG: dethiobiotin synthase [Planctomycetota bacterium]
MSAAPRPGLPPVETAPVPLLTDVPRRGLFVVGTDTDVGKTAVAVAVLRQLVAASRRPAAYKPVASGIAAVGESGGDPERLWEATGRVGAIRDVCPQCFPAALSPPRAARTAGRSVDESLLRTGLLAWRDHEIVVVEGAGGLFSPLAATTLGADLARAFGYPLVVVDAARLGAIGRTLATVLAARAAGLTVAACVLSQAFPPRGNPDDPTGDGAIAAANVADLRQFLADVPITLLSHGAIGFAPPLDWWAFADGFTHPGAGPPPPRPATG